MAKSQHLNSKLQSKKQLQPEELIDWIEKKPQSRRAQDGARRSKFSDGIQPSQLLRNFPGNCFPENRAETDEMTKKATQSGL